MFPKISDDVGDSFVSAWPPAKGF